MTTEVENLASLLDIYPESFPLEDQDIDTYMVLIAEPYGLGDQVPETYEDLLSTIDKVLHMNIKKEHMAYLRSIPRNLRTSIGAWQSFSDYHMHHNIRLYMEDPIDWKQKLQRLHMKVEDESKILGYIENINSIINGAPPLSEGITVFRKVTRNPELSYVTRKMDFINRSFTSTTTWYQVARSYESLIGKVIKIYLPEGTRCLYFGIKEQEILLPANSYFRYESSEPMPTYTLVQ